MRICHFYRGDVISDNKIGGGIALFSWPVTNGADSPEKEMAKALSPGAQLCADGNDIAERLVTV